MPFCQNCGRKLAENEVCNCTADAAPAPAPQPTAVPTPPPAPAAKPAEAHKPAEALKPVEAPKPEAAPQPASKPAEAPKPANNGAAQTPPPAPKPANGATQTPPPAAQPQAVYQNVNVQQKPKKKTSVGLIIALILIPIVLIILIIVLILAAIFVPSMLGYVNKSKISSANSSATSLYKAANSALTELDEEGNTVYGFYVICSDKENNYNIPDKFDEDEFYKKMNNFFADNKKMDWFIVCEYGSATYTAQSENWKNEIVGTYPNPATADGPCYYDTYYLSTTKRTKASLTKLYNDAAKKIKQKAEDASYYDYY